ncbi:hypothetical protein DH2020_028887 [Rehmannia glutinosa]|uniref:Uncharacterized protein n=1 Tax=Rehmannia glutinosa TaxID=99300 RepID=A0ABR0VTR5_REHGL
MGKPADFREASRCPTSQRGCSKERKVYRPVPPPHDKGKTVVNSMDDTAPFGYLASDPLSLVLVPVARSAPTSSKVSLGNSFSVLAEEEELVHNSPPSDVAPYAPADTQPMPLASQSPQSGVRNSSISIQYPSERPTRLLSRSRDKSSDSNRLQRDVLLGPTPPIHQLAITRDSDGAINLNITAAKRWAYYDDEETTTVIEARNHTDDSLSSHAATEDNTTVSHSRSSPFHVLRGADTTSLRQGWIVPLLPLIFSLFRRKLKMQSTQSYRIFFAIRPILVCKDK